MDLGEWIKKYRNEHGLSMQAFADKCGFSKAYIGQLEKGINPSTGKPISPTLQTFEKIANGTNMSVDNLMMELDENQPVSLPGKKQAYYLDPEVADIANELKDRPDLRVLLDASRDLTSSDMFDLIDTINKIKNGKYEDK